MDDRPPEMHMRCERAVVVVYIVFPSTCRLLRLATDFLFSTLFFSFLHFKYPLFRFSHYLSFRSVLQGYLLEMQVTRLTGTEAVVCVSRDSRETAVSWRKCRRKVDARLGHLNVASASTCVAARISSESPRSAYYRSKKSLAH